MVTEVLHWLAPKEGDVYVDCTIGTGGHSEAILEKARCRISLIGIDRDEETLKVAKEALKKYQSHISLVKANFKHLPQILKEKKAAGLCLNVDGAIGAVISEMGISPAAGKALFIIPRSAGILGQLVEQKAGSFFRLDNESITYVGPQAPRKYKAVNRH